jgi:hypothetical protein
MNSRIDVDDLILNYDPEFPQERFLTAGLAGALKSSTGRLPSVVPWPDGSAPTAKPLNPPPAPTDDLSRFAGYDAVVVTWTAAEAAALAALFTPDYLPSRWYQYKFNVKDYLPLVTGPRAPFKDSSSEMARYYHCLGLYFPCTIGSARVLLFKSGLHLDYDGPAIPVKKLMAEIADTIKPRLFITTGTGGGIGANVALGDVIIATTARFDCATQFKDLEKYPWGTETFTPSPVPPGALQAITPDLTRVNASRIEGARGTPKIWASDSAEIVTTDFFGFDDSTNHDKLQGNNARVCDMGDAMVGYALKDLPGLEDMKWYTIRNASDPQIPNPNNDIETAKQQAGKIYAEYGAFTTAASAIATWAVIDSTVNSKQRSNTMPNKTKKTASKHAVSSRKASGPLARLAIRIPSKHGAYGWIPDLPDARDFLYSAPPVHAGQPLPPSVDLRSKCPPIYDQGQLGSCTGNGIAGAIEFDQIKQGNVEFTPSRLFIYYNERAIEGTVNQDAGAQVRDGIKSVATLGAPPETDWPYDISKFASKPPAKAYSDAKQNLVALYARVAQNLSQMQGCLADGFPIVFGFTVYESFESAAVARTGVVPMPSSSESVLGGHCVVAVGYNDTQRRFIVRNSWGTDWGLKGYCTMPYEFLLNSQYANDFWTIRSVMG